MDRKINTIDYIRVIATLIVFMLHTAIFTAIITDGKIWIKLKQYFFLYTPAWAGVWIFFIISGYLIGRGFVSKRYTLSRKKILEFYLSKLIKIGIPTLSFIFFSCVLIYPRFIFDNKGVLRRILTFTYNGIPGVDGIGAVWYVSTIMQLYLISPIIIYIVEKVKKVISNKYLWGIWIGVILIGLLLRYVMYKNNADWHTQIYTPSILNLDLFVSGILTSYLPKPSIKRNRIIILWIIFGTVLLCNCFIYSRDNNICYFIYQYLFPSIYAIIVNILIYYAMDFNETDTNEITNTINKVILIFSNISFQFYLWHSLILSTIYSCITTSGILVMHIKLLGISFILTFIIASFFTKAFSSLLKPLYLWNKEQE